MSNNFKEIFAHAKVNLSLQITARRSDGMHQLYSFVAFARDIFDQITIKEASDKNSVEFLNNNTITPDDNSIKRVLDQVTHYTDKYFTVKVLKNIPVAGGLGGGSADAGAILRYFKKVFKIENCILNKIAINTGADVPACLYNKPCIMAGIGEKISPSQIKFAIPAVFINPCTNLLTKDVFEHYKKNINKFSITYNLTNSTSINTILNIPNDLQESAISLMPNIRKILNILNSQHSCITAKLCGSGPTCFGIFSNEKDAKIAKRKIKYQNTGWFVKFSWIANNTV